MQMELQVPLASLEVRDGAYIKDWEAMTSRCRKPAIEFWK